MPRRTAFQFGWCWAPGTAQDASGFHQRAAGLGRAGGSRRIIGQAICVRERSWREGSLPEQTAARLGVEVVPHKHPALLEGETRLVKRSILANDLLPIPILAEFVLDGPGNLDGALMAFLQVSYCIPG